MEIEPIYAQRSLIVSRYYRRHDSVAHYVTTLSPTHLLRTNCDLDPSFCSTNVAAKQWDRLRM